MVSDNMNTSNVVPAVADLKEQSKQFSTSGVTETISIDGVDMSYWRQGDGSDTVVFIHGNSFCKEAFYQQFEYFKDSGMSLIAIDLPGHGGSANAAVPEKQYTIPGYAQIVNHLLDAIGVSNPIIVGWSLGGNIALEMAGQGQSLKGLFINGAPPVGPGDENVWSAYIPTEGFQAAGQKEASKEQLEDFVKECCGLMGDIPDLFYTAVTRADGVARETMVGHWLGGTDGHDQVQTVSNWSNPICVVQGISETMVSLDYLKNVPWKNLWKNTVLELEESSHAPFLENPQAYNSLLEEFIKDLS